MKEQLLSPVRRPQIRVGLFSTSVQFGGIDRLLLTLLQHVDPSVSLYPVVFTRTDAKETAYFDHLRAMGIDHATLYVNALKPEWVANPLWNFVQATQLFSRQRLDLIHSHGYRANLFGLAIATCLGVPIISTCHGFVSTDRRLRLYNRLDRLALRRFTRVIAVSGQMREELVASGVKERNIDVITNAVEEVQQSEFARARNDIRARCGVHDGQFLFGYVGRLSDEKGPQYLLDALRTLPAGGNSARLLFVGDGAQRRELERVADRGTVCGDVIFAGFQSDPGHWYPAMDAFVLPSLTEGTPLALLEAMMHRVPVIATSVGGVPAVIKNGENGLLVPPADPIALANAMASVANDPLLRLKLSHNAYRTVRQDYGAGDWARKVRDVYARVLPQAAN